jgi:hypothetical protein
MHALAFCLFFYIILVIYTCIPDLVVVTAFVTLPAGMHYPQKRRHHHSAAHKVTPMKRTGSGTCLRTLSTEWMLMAACANPFPLPPLELLAPPPLWKAIYACTWRR